MERTIKQDTNTSTSGSQSATTSSSSFRAHSPPVEWGPKEFNVARPKHGRVGIFQAKSPGMHPEPQSSGGLLTGFTDRDSPSKKLRATYVQALNRQALTDYLRTAKEDSDEILFHIFHIQNARWALDILNKEYNINKQPAGNEFLKYTRHSMRQDPGGKPYLMGKSWPLQTDEDSGTRQMFLSFDYLKEYAVSDPLSASPTKGLDRILELSSYNDEGSSRSCRSLKIFANMIQAMSLMVMTLQCRECPVSFSIEAFYGQRNERGSAKAPRTVSQATQILSLRIAIILPMPPSFTRSQGRVTLGIHLFLQEPWRRKTG